MNEFNQNEQMELLLTAKLKQPDLYSQLPAATKMAVGIFESTKTTAIGLTTDELLQLRGLKKSISQDVLSPQERTALALKISELETK